MICFFGKSGKYLLNGILAAALIAAFLFCPAEKAEAAYPDKPVTMIVAYSPGGGTDTVARVIAKYVEPYLGQRLIIENKPGAGGQIGFTALAQTRPDGYKIGFINIPTIFMVKMLRQGVPYSMADFTPIANIQLDPVILAVKADSPFKNLNDLVEYAKKNPGKVNIGGDGPQSNNQLQLVIAQKKLGVNLNFVSYSGSGPAVTALLGGQVDAAVPSGSSIAQHIQAGRVRALCVFSEEPYDLLPDVPTASQAAGVKIPAAGAAMRGIAAPKGMDPEQIKVLEDAFSKVMKDEGFLEKAKEMGLPLKYMDSATFTETLKASEEEIEQYIDLLK